MDAASHNAAIEDDEDDQTCLYCANLKALRDLLPPKRCDYCRQWRCQFCTLKFPLLGLRKGLPKALKGNSRICVQCFGRVWQESESAGQPGPNHVRGRRQPTKHVSLTDPVGPRRESRGVSFEDQGSMFESGGRRGSIFDSSLTTGSSRRSSTMGSSRRNSILENERRESMMVDRVWAGVDSFSSGQRLSFMDNSSSSDITKRSIIPASNRDGFSFRMASFLGLVPNDEHGGNSITSAIDLWISLFAASMLMVIALADGFSLQQRVIYCVATYGLFLTLHPWIHAGQKEAMSSFSGSTPEPSTKCHSEAPHPRTALKVRRRRKSLDVSGGTPLPVSYKSRIQEMEKTLQYYLSDDAPWKMIKAARRGEIFELTENETPFAIFKIEVFVTGISMENFMDFLDSKDPRDRSVWDLNEANFEVIETFDNSDVGQDAEVSVCVNSQKPFLGGLVAPRDFCLLYVSKENYICFSSVEHARVPARLGTTRGNIFFSCFHCQEDESADGPTGFKLTYICQADIGGSLPVKLLYNGTMDNMEKMARVFQQANRVFPR